MKKTMDEEKESMPTIPHDWWCEAGMDAFRPSSKSYASDSTELASISEIQSPRRNVGVKYFEKDRMTPILRGLIKGEVIPPIEVNEVNNLGQYRYRVHNGFHRFYASLAAGFECVPVVVKPYFDINEL